MPHIVSRVLSARPLLIKSIAAETNRLINEEKASIIALSQGTPNLPIFPSAAEEMIKLIESKKLPYTDVAGMTDVKEIAAKFVNSYYSPKENPFRAARIPAITDLVNDSSIPSHCISSLYTPVFNSSNVLLTAGAAQSVYNVLALSIESPNDIVISPLPAYGLYQHQTSLLGGTFVALETKLENDYIPTVEEFRTIFDRYTYTDSNTGIIKNHIKSIVLCTPNNPMGTILSPMESYELSQFFIEQLNRGFEFSILLDEVYIGIEIGHSSVLNWCTNDKLLDSIFLVLSASKGMGAAPGLRAGYLIAQSKYIQQMIKIQMACTANSSSISQRGLYGSLKYIIENPMIFNSIYDHYQSRVQYASQQLNIMGQKYFQLNLVHQYNNKDQNSIKSPATFYLMVNFSPLPGFTTDIEIQEYLRDEYKYGKYNIGVAVVPGSAFSLNSLLKYIRLSCAVEMNDLELSMKIIDSAIEKLVIKHSMK